MITHTLTSSMSTDWNDMGSMTADEFRHVKAAQKHEQRKARRRQRLHMNQARKARRR